ncbi:hypothetical protein ACIQCJ_05095 [Streptomyces sp. NPDC093221]|uniref:hypothetical protein n=1 Tax=Streptomyces sp. NPDC093221 TaxID=3366032 RepID=UPI00381B20E7
MTEHSGGHYLETGGALVLLDHPVGRGVESPAVAAWRAYVDHTRGDCEQCPTDNRACPVANALWTEYAGTRPAS